MDPKTVVVVDEDRDIAELVQTILIDEGFKVALAYTRSESELKEAIERMDPDCVLLDGTGGAGYLSASWEIAAWLASRPRAIPTLMFTENLAAMDEAALDASPRAQAARFVGMLPKPFNVDELIEAVHRATGVPVPPTDREEADQQAALIERLRAAGADELTTSNIGRVWVTFRAGADRLLYKAYRWRTAGTYFIGRYVADGRQLEPLAQFSDFEALVAFCVTQIREPRLS